MQVSPRLPWHMLLGAVVLVPLAVGVIPVAGIPITLNSFVQAKLIVLSLMLSLALAAWAATEFGGVLRLGGALVPLAAFLLVAGLSMATALEPRMAFFGDLEQGVGFLVVLMCGLACFLTTQLADRDERSTTLTSAVILTAAAVAAVGLLQQAVLVDLLGIGGASLPEWFMRRGYGTIGNADTYGAYLVLPALLALDRLRRATDRDRLLWGACFIAIASSCIASQTRGSWVALVAGGITYAVLLRATARATAPARRGSKRTAKEGRATRPWQVGAVVAAALGVALLVAAVLGDTAGFLRRFGGGGESLLALGGRTPLWGNALRIVAAHPALGVGPDSFRLGWYPVREVSQLAQGAGLINTDPHNALLLIAATMGMSGLAAALYLIGATAVSGFKSMRKTRSGSPQFGPDQLAWLAGFIALAVALLSSMVTIALLFMLFLAIGVLVAPTLSRIDTAKSSRTVVRATRIVAGVASISLLAFSVLTFSAQVVAVGARSDDADLAHSRAASALSIAPWDTQLRDLEHETLVNAALEQVFTGQADAVARVDAADRVLAGAGVLEPHEYLHPYRAALLLIGSGQKLGDAYTRRGIDAGLRALAIYPNSLELRTGMASGYLRLGEPQKAEALLGGVWSADPAYVMSGLTYVEALYGLGRTAEARDALALLRRRFPQDQSVTDLGNRLFPTAGGSTAP